jgi:VIT1/CCC1 family predicted Fe2+/Mn2+ transporter
MSTKKNTMKWIVRLIYLAGLALVIVYLISGLLRVL